MTTNRHGIRVSVRVRPRIGTERNLTNDPDVYFLHPDKNMIFYSPNLCYGTQKYQYDRVFDELSDIVTIYQHSLGHIVESSTSGRSGALFTNGVVSSGKTFTTFGDENSPGLVDLAMRHLFSLCETTNKQMKIYISFLEVYEEVIYDLLSDGQKGVVGLMDDSRLGVHCSASEVEVEDENDVKDLLTLGNTRKLVMATSRSAQSSRSHTIVRISVESLPAPSPEGFRTEDLEAIVTESLDSATCSPCSSPKRPSKPNPLVGVVSIVDLAAAESLRQMGGEDARAGPRHISKVNQSLLSLNRVIHELAAMGHVTYRGSKLTRLLEPCLSAYCGISILCCMTTALWCADETRCALEFAATARRLQLSSDISTETRAMRQRRGILKRQVSTQARAKVSSSSNALRAPRTAPASRRPCISPSTTWDLGSPSSSRNLRDEFEEVERVAKLKSDFTPRSFVQHAVHLRDQCESLLIELCKNVEEIVMAEEEERLFVRCEVGRVTDALCESVEEIVLTEEEERLFVRCEVGRVTDALCESVEVIVLTEEEERLLVRSEVNQLLQSLCGHVDTMYQMSIICENVVESVLSLATQHEASRLITAEIGEVLSQLTYDIEINYQACRTAGVTNLGQIEGAGEAATLADRTAMAESILRYECTRTIESNSVSGQSLSRLGIVYARNAMDAFNLILRLSRQDLETAEAALREAQVETSIAVRGVECLHHTGYHIGSVDFKAKQ